MTQKITFVDNSKKVKKQLTLAEERALTKIGLLIQSAAKREVRIDTSGLLNSINYKIDDSAKKVLIGTNKDHGIYNEFGTGEHAENGAGRKGGWFYQTPDGKWHHTQGMKAKPFLRPAFRNNKKNIIKTLENEVGGAFDD